MTRRHGMTPVEWLDDLGVLADGTIVSHGIFLNDHPWLHWPQADDFGRLVRSGAGVAHCPNVFWRRGIALNHVGRYMSAGIPLGLGTDTFPHNFLPEMEIATVAGRKSAERCVGKQCVSPCRHRRRPHHCNKTQTNNGRAITLTKSS